MNRRNTALLAIGGLLLTGLCRAEDEPPASQVGSTENETAYFLSSSVPEKQLAILMKAAESRGIPVYFRGLIGDSMEQTAGYMLHMVKTWGVKGVQIDPMRFDRYGVKQVPALVRKCGDRFDILYGNIALNQALDMIDKRGDCRVSP